MEIELCQKIKLHGVTKVLNSDSALTISGIANLVANSINKGSG